MEIKYDTNTAEMDHSPDPKVFVELAIAEIAKLTKEAIDKAKSESVTYTDAQASEILGKVDTIVSADGLAEKLQVLKSLVDTLDLDSDGAVVNDLLAIRAVAQAAEAAAAAAQSDADSAKSDAARNRATFEAFRDSTSAQIQSVFARVAVLESDIKNNASQIVNVSDSLADLRDYVSGLPTESGISFEEASDMIQKSMAFNNRRYKMGFGAGLEQMATIYSGVEVAPSSDSAGAQNF